MNVIIDIDVLVDFQFHAKQMAKIWAYFQLIHFLEKKIHEKYVEVINKVYPPEVFEVTEWLQQIENNLETHD